MFGRIWDFVKRHKKKFIFTSVIVGGVVVAGRYVQWKLKQVTDRETAECLSHARRQHHFDNNQRTCNTTVLSMLPNIRESIMKLLDTEMLTIKLKSRPSDKLAIWEELKVKSFARVVVSIYSSCMLVLVLRVRLNILGAYMYLDNYLNRNGTSPSIAIATQRVQQRYLEEVQYILGKGLNYLTEDVLKAVESVVGPKSLKSNLSREDVVGLIQAVRDKVENQANATETTVFKKYMISSKSASLENEHTGHCDRDLIILEKLRQETEDILDSGDFQSLLSMCLDICHDKLADILDPVFTSSESNSKLPLAKLIPVMDKMIYTILSDVPNQFIQDLLLMDKVKDFAANVYEAFSQTDEVSSV